MAVAWGCPWATRRPSTPALRPPQASRERPTADKCTPSQRTVEAKILASSLCPEPMFAIRCFYDLSYTHHELSTSYHCPSSPSHATPPITNPTYLPMFAPTQVGVPWAIRRRHQHQQQSSGLHPPGALSRTGRPPRSARQTPVWFINSNNTL